MCEFISLFRMTVIALDPFVPRRVRQTDIAKRGHQRYALRVYFHRLFDHIVIGARAALTLHREICFQTFWKLSDLSIAFCERERIVVDFRNLATGLSFECSRLACHVDHTFGAFFLACAAQ